MRYPAGIFLAMVGALCWSADYNVQRAHFNYQMFCQGCHTPDGTGSTNVPRMKDHVGYFTAFSEGREYLVRVPGSATSSLSDGDLAEVLNWIVSEFSGQSANHGFKPYTAAEVGQLRQRPLNEVARYREELLVQLASANSGD